MCGPATERCKILRKDRNADPKIGMGEKFVTLLYVGQIYKDARRRLFSAGHFSSFRYNPHLCGFSHRLSNRTRRFFPQEGNFRCITGKIVRRLQDRTAVRTAPDGKLGGQSPPDRVFLPRFWHAGLFAALSIQAVVQVNRPQARKPNHPVKFTEHAIEILFRDHILHQTHGRCRDKRPFSLDSSTT